VADDWDPEPKAPPGDPAWDANWVAAEPQARRKTPVVGLLVAAVLVAIVVLALANRGGAPSSGGQIGLGGATASPSAGRSTPATSTRRPTSAPATAAASLDPPGEPATVIRVVDGDTIHARLNGVDEKVRIIGMDSPESVKPNTPVECMAREASAAAKRLLKPGDRILLQPDPTQDTRDRYGRLLAHVFLSDGTLFAETMIRQGDAIHYIYDGVPSIHADQLAAAEAAAKASQVGLWSPTTCQGNAHEATRSPLP